MNAGFLRVKVPVLRDAIKGTLVFCVCLRGFFQRLKMVAEVNVGLKNSNENRTEKISFL
jgi:hypothetical protein